MRDATERGDPQAIPVLVDRLEDEDPAVRFFAVLALERLTGTRMGFQAGAAAEERRLAVARWRRYVLDRGAAHDASKTENRADGP